MMQQLYYALPAGPLPAAKQTLWPARLAKQLTAGWLPAVLLLLTLASSAVQANAQTSGCTTPSFATAANFGAGTNPYSVITGDFNRDGRLDIATANYNSNNVSVLLANSTGGFLAATNYDAGTNPFSVTTGDFNGDGRADIATANYFSDNVSVLLNNGTGGFLTVTNYGVGGRPRSVTTGDFNGDGKADIIAANQSSSSVSLLLGDGTGSFATATNYATGAEPQSVTVGDFNGDGRLDLATANAVPNRLNLSVLLNNGAGGFAAPTNYSVAGNGSFSVTTGDFNGDGRLDLATANSNGTVSVLRGNGTGGFAVRNDFGAGIGSFSVTTGDFNGDGRLDIATANRADNVSVLLGDGAGGFATATNFGVGSNSQSVTTGDFNGDGKLDIATANSNGTVSVLLNTCSSTCPATSFAAATNYDAGTSPRSVITGDFNKDGRLDIATANANSGNVSVLLANSSGSFGTATNFPVGNNPQSVTTADFNGDGRLDIATANSSNTVSVLLANSTGGFGTAANFNVGDIPQSVTTGDFNGDGRLDIATARANSANVSVLLANSTGGFAMAINFNIGSNSSSVTTGDFNGDGKLDIATANDNSNVSVLLGNGAGSFSAPTNFGVGRGPQSVTTGDFNGDGKLDLATANLVSSNVSVLLGNGAGSFSAPTNFSVGSQPRSVITGDFNGDGKADIATANANSSNVSVLLGNGAGDFAAATNFSAGSGTFSITTGDFDRDGRLDIATANNGANSVSVLLNTCMLAKPVITASGPTTFCAGDSVILSAPAGFASYLWSNGATTQSITVTTSGSYTVTVTNNTGATSPASDPVVVTVNALPAAPTVTPTQPTCSTPTGTITVNTPTGTGITYSINGTDYQGGNTFSNLSPSTYNVRARANSGCISAATPVTINAAPATLAAPTVSVVQPSCTIATGSITVNSPTGSDITYSINGTTYQSGTTFSNIAPGNYNVTARSGSCTSAATPVTINAQPTDNQPPVITPRNITINLNATGNATIQPADVIVSATDNCSLDSSSFTVTPNSFSCSGSAGSANHQAYVANTNTGNQAWTGELGMEFRVNRAGGILVKQLGAFDHQGNGITGTQSGGIRVAIFNKTTQSIVAGLETVITGNADSYLGNHRLKNIAPVTLLPGDYVIVSKGYNTTELNGNVSFGGISPTLGDEGNGAISFTGSSRFGTPNTATFSYPQNGDGGPTNRYLAGTFVYDVAATADTGSANHQAYVANTTTGNQSWAGELGMEFRVNQGSGILVKQLGTFDHQGNGITGTQSGGIRVAIFNKATRSIVAGLETVIIGNADRYTRNHRMKDIAPVTLMPGDYVIVSKGYNNNEMNGNVSSGGIMPTPGDVSNGAISYTGTGLYGNPNSATFSYPQNGDGGPANRYLAGTFVYDVPGTTGGGVGNNSVVISVKDAAGNIGYATATVTVTDANGVCNQSQPIVSIAATTAVAPVLAGAATMRTEGIKVYPNPTSGSFNVLLSDVSGATIRLEVMDGNGKVVAVKALTLTGKTPVLTVPFDLGNKAPGMYWIRAVSTTGVQTARVLIQR